VKVIDCHTHLEDGEYYRKERNIELRSTLQDFSRLCKEMPSLQFVLTAGENVEDRNTENNYLVSHIVQGNPDVFVGYMPRINPNDLRELDDVKSMPHRGIVGLKVSSSLSKVPINDLKMHPIVKYGIEADLPIFFHCGRWLEMSSCTLLGELAGKYPDAKLIMGHMGGASLEITWEGIRVAKKHRNIWMDTSSCFFEGIAKKAVEEVGVDRILFGSDYPYYSPITSYYYLKNELGEAVLSKVLENPYRLFKTGG